MSQGDMRKLKADFESVQTILEDMGGGSGPSGESYADQKMRELFLESTEEVPETETTDEEKSEVTKEPPTLEIAMNEKIEPNFEVITKQHLSASVRDQAVDRLMTELNSEMKSSNPDWEKIQRVMGDLMGLKKTGELLDQLKTEVNKRGVKWESVREIMAKLWAIKKEIIIDLLPTLLKS